MTLERPSWGEARLEQDVSCLHEPATTSSTERNAFLSDYKLVTVSTAATATEERLQVHQIEKAEITIRIRNPQPQPQPQHKGTLLTSCQA
jgi:hypothetical protein